MQLDRPSQATDPPQWRRYFMMKPWQIWIFETLFRPLPIPRWVTGGQPRLADLLMFLSGLAGAMLLDWRRVIGIVFLGAAISIGLLMLVWHVWIAALVEQRNHRILHGLCLRCGYDLRATPDKCPECGLVPEQQT